MAAQTFKKIFQAFFCGDSNFGFLFKFPTLPFLTGGRVGQPHTMPRRRGVKSCPQLPYTPQLLPASQQYGLIEQRELLGVCVCVCVNKANWQHALHSQLEDINHEQAELW